MKGCMNMKINENFLKLSENFLFSLIAKKVKAFKENKLIYNKITRIKKLLV